MVVVVGAVVVLVSLFICFCGEFGKYCFDVFRSEGIILVGSYIGGFNSFLLVFEVYRGYENTHQFLFDHLLDLIGNEGCVTGDKVFAIFFICCGNTFFEFLPCLVCFLLEVKIITLWVEETCFQYGGIYTPDDLAILNYMFAFYCKLYTVLHFFEECFNWGGRFPWYLHAIFILRDHWNQR